MASPQIENGYTRIANELLEHFTFAGINGSEYRIILIIIRKTYGFNKKKDRISISQFQETGMRRINVVRTIKSLIRKKIIFKENGVYELNKDWEDWVVVKRLPPDVGSSQLTTRSSSQLTTHKRKKESKDIRKLKISGKNMKKNSLSNPYKENKHSDSYEDVIDIDTGEFEKAKSTKKYPNAKKVYDLWVKYPKNWIINKTQLLSAENLYEERGLIQIKKALLFYKENKHLKFCPQITSPFDLDSKWTKLIKFKKDL